MSRLTSDLSHVTYVLESDTSSPAIPQHLGLGLDVAETLVVGLEAYHLVRSDVAETLIVGLEAYHLVGAILPFR
jgi:hypothetical protein